jgi:arsenate reductase (thioredoxin)
MAEGFLRALGGDRYDAHSAGTQPSALNAMAIEVMREAGIDISGQRSKNAGEYLGQHFAHVITVCDNAREHCPIFPGTSRREHWPFEDPAHAKGSPVEVREVFRRVRDEIGAKVREFAERS